MTVTRERLQQAFWTLQAELNAEGENEKADRVGRALKALQESPQSLDRLAAIFDEEMVK